MGNSKTERAKAQRAQTARAAQQKGLDAGGIRFSLLLEPPYAQQFIALAEAHGSKKAALLYLLQNASKTV